MPKIYLLFLALLAFLVGCAANQVSPEGEGTRAAAVRGFEDVPVPGNIELAMGESFVYESEALRTGVLVYYGYVSVDSLVNYLKSAMPQQGWNLVNSFFYRGAALNFEKGNRVALINISKGWFKTRVEVRVGPKGAPAGGPPPR